MTPDASAERPRVIRSQISLIASDRRRATMARVSFHVDKALISCLRAGDVLHLSRTECAGIGVSVLRQGTLVVAVGAVTAVPLGSGVAATIPTELIERAADVFREGDEEFEFPESPLEIRVGSSRSVLFSGRRTFGDYGVIVVHGFREGDPGDHECAAIYRTTACPETAAHASAMLLDLPDVISMSGW
jgi:hypothetical protein